MKKVIPLQDRSQNNFIAILNIKFALFGQMWQLKFTETFRFDSKYCNKLIFATNPGSCTYSV